MYITVYEGEGRRPRTEERKASVLVLRQPCRGQMFIQRLHKGLPFSASFSSLSPFRVGSAGKSRWMTRGRMSSAIWKLPAVKKSFRQLKIPLPVCLASVVGRDILLASTLRNPALHFSFTTLPSASASKLPRTSLIATLDLICLSSPLTICLNSGVARLSAKSTACTPGCDTIT